MAAIINSSEVSIIHNIKSNYECLFDMFSFIIYSSLWYSIDCNNFIKVTSIMASKNKAEKVEKRVKDPVSVSFVSNLGNANLHRRRDQIKKKRSHIR